MMLSFIESPFRERKEYDEWLALPADARASALAAASAKYATSSTAAAPALAEAESNYDQTLSLVLYKLVPAAEVPEDAWRTRLSWTTCFGLREMKANKFIHLLTADQLVSEVEGKHASKADIMLLSFTVQTMRDEADLKVKFEAAESAPGGDGKFAHIYGGAIPYACLYSAPTLLTLADGKHVFPPVGLAQFGVAGEGQEEIEEANSSDDDGLEPFDQSRFDEDD